MQALQDALTGTFLFSGGKVEISLPKFSTEYHLLLEQDGKLSVATLTREELLDHRNRHDIHQAQVPTGPFGKWLAENVEWEF